MRYFYFVTEQCWNWEATLTSRQSSKTDTNKKTIKPDKCPIFGASTSDPRFAAGVLLADISSGVMVPLRDGVTLDFCALFTNLQINQVFKLLINSLSCISVIYSLSLWIF